MDLVKVNAMRLIEGFCWMCLERLGRREGDDFGECPSCGRRFCIRGRMCLEQIPLGPEWGDGETRIYCDANVWTELEQFVQVPAGGLLPVGARFIELAQEIP